MFRLHRNYDSETGNRGIEAVSVCLFGCGVELRWRSAADGITPHVCLIWWLRHHSWCKSVTFYGAD
jgi:hypothetical protein